MSKVSEWNPGEPMSREFALAALDEIKCFYRRLYFAPERKPFVTDAGFEGATQVLNGLKKLIEDNVTE